MHIGDDKISATERKYLWGFDATDTLWRFARLCALDVVHLWDAPDIVVRYLKTGDESIRDAAWDAARAAARFAARDAAWAAARAAARAAAWDAARAAARAAAWDAARAAARDAAGDAVSILAGNKLDKLHREHLRARMEVWRKGYALLCDVDGVLYVYAKKGGV